MISRRRFMAAGAVPLIGVALVAGSCSTLVEGSGPVSSEPPPGDSVPIEPVRETLGSGRSAVAPERVLLLTRRTFAPGADSGAHPAMGPVVLFVESGRVGFTVVEGAALVTRGAGADLPAASPATTEEPETLEEGVEVMLEPGDSVSYDEGVVHTVRNVGDGDAVTLEARLNPV